MFRFRLRSLMLFTIATAVAVYGYVAYQRYQIEHLFVSVVDNAIGTPLTQFRYRTTIRTERGQTISPWAEWRSDKGKLTIKIPIHCRVWLEVESNQGDTKYAFQSEDLVVSPSTSHHWVRRVKPFVPLRNPNRVAAWLVDSESKQPIVNARIYRIGDTIHEMQISPYISDNNGRFVLEDVSAFIVHHPDYEQAGTKVGETFELDRCKRVSGIVFSPDGKPIADCNAEIKKTAPNEMAKTTKTDRDGRFSIWLTKAEIRANKLEISHQGWQTERIETESRWNSVMSITLKHSDSVPSPQAERTQFRGSRKIKGKVVCAASELRNVLVQLRTEHEVALRPQWEEYWCSFETQLDNKGQFVIPNVGDGHFELIVRWKNQVLCRRPVIVQGGNIDVPDVKLPERGRIRGRIAALQTGRATAFQEMWFGDFHRMKAVPCFTDQNGEFTIDELLPGKWFVGEGSLSSSSLHTNGHDVKVITVSPNSTALCLFPDQEPLQVEIPRVSAISFYSNWRNLGTGNLKLDVGDSKSKQLIASFDRKFKPHAELMFREGHRRLVQLTVYNDTDVEIINRELDLEKGETSLQWPEDDTKVVIYRPVPSETTPRKGVTRTIVSFSQSGIEKHRFVRTWMASPARPSETLLNGLHTDSMWRGFYSSLFESGNYDVVVHSDDGWAKLNCTIPKGEHFVVGPLEHQKGGSIVGRILLADKQTYPTSVRITSDDGFALENSLVGRDAESFEFSGLPPGNWTIELIDNTQTDGRQVLKKASIGIVAIESVNIEL